MRKFIIAIAIAGISAISAQPAHATDWWILDAGKGQCVNAALLARQTHYAPGESPGAYQADLRSAGAFKDVGITRDDDGKPLIVRIEDIKGRTIIYTPTHEVCENVLSIAMAKGYVGTKRELN